MDRGHVELLFDDLVQGTDQPNSTEQELIELQTPILRHPATWPNYPARAPTPGVGSMVSPRMTRSGSQSPFEFTNMPTFVRLDQLYG